MLSSDPDPRLGFKLPFLKTRHTTFPHARLPLAQRMPEQIRTAGVACAGEFVGTFLFLFFALAGTQVANDLPSSYLSSGSDPARLLYISLAFGFSLAVNAWVFYRVSGGLFNPAVTLGMCLISALSYTRGMLLFATQLVAAVTAAKVVQVLFPGDLNVQTRLGAGTSVAQGFWIEAFLTFQLVLAIFMLAAEKHRATFIAPVGIGLSLFISELTGVHFTGGSLNPARSLGPALVLWSFPSYHWIYWAGPLLGAVVAALFYKLLKVLEYESANPNAHEHEQGDVGKIGEDEGGQAERN